MEHRADGWIWSAAAPEGSGAALVRRGFHHGWISRGPARRLSGAEARERWAAAAPLHLRGALAPDAEARRAVARTAALFRRCRGGGGLEAEVWRRLGERSGFEPAGVTVDLGDDREIEKVHADRKRPPAADLWAKLSWISTDPRDASLRIRFSFGAERFDDWRTEPERARATDALAEAVFPECRLLTRNRSLLRFLRERTGGPVRLSERIVFSNAPGGGAVFHHDAEEGQLGVVFAQMTGRTAWLALPKRQLARHVAALAKGTLAAGTSTESKALRALENHDLPELERLLNRSRRLTRRLVEAGALYVPAAGDVLLLPSHGRDDAAWHSVFALGEHPSVAHSYGIFRG